MFELKVFRRCGRGEVLVFEKKGGKGSFLVSAGYCPGPLCTRVVKEEFGFMGRRFFLKYLLYYAGVWRRWTEGSTCNKVMK